MKLSVKFTLSMILMITLVLSIGGVIFMAGDFNQNYDNMVELSYQQHNAQLSQLQLFLKDMEADTPAQFHAALYQYGNSLDQYGGGSLAIFMDGALAYLNLENQPDDSALAELARVVQEEQVSALNLEQAGEGVSLYICSNLQWGESAAQLITAHDFTSVYTRRDNQVSWFARIQLAALAVTALAAGVVSGALTAPLKKLTATATAIAMGDYSARTQVESQDEIGSLSQSFDTMAQAVENQIQELNLSVTQRDDFIAAFTHEIKTPMTGIIGYADILRESPPDPKTLHTASEAIYHDARRLEQLSQKLLLLLGLNREEELELRPVSLAKVFRGAREALGNPSQVEWPKGTELRVWGDEILLVDLVQNLVQNGIRSLEEEGRVQVDAELQEDLVLIQITDNGCGIPEDQLERITEPFYMVDKSRARRMNGSGVGLALCARIAQLHGTQLSYQSQVGEGTQCSFTLEVAHEENQ